MSFNKIFSQVVFALIPFFAMAEIVESVEFSGLRLLSKDKVADMLVIPYGTDIGPQDLKKQIQIFYDTGLFKQVLITQEGTVLHIELIEQPIIRDIDINSSIIPSAEIKKQLDALGLVAGEVLNEFRLHQLAVQLTASIQEMGFPNAKVELKVEEKDDLSALVTIDIITNDAIKISKILFEGNKQFSNRTLSSVIQSKPAGVLSFLFHDNLYSAMSLQSDKGRLEAYYRSRGYLQPDITLDVKQVTPLQRIWSSKYNELAYKIDAGPLFKVERVVFEDDDAWGVELKNKINSLVTNKAYNKPLKSLILKEVKNYFKDREVNGEHFGVHVDHDISGYDAVTLKLRVNKDVRHVRFINFVGNKNTMDETLRKVIKLQETQPFDNDLIVASKYAINNLGYIKEVNISLVKVDGNLYDVLIEVKEASTFQMDLKAEYAGGASLSASASDSNILGTGNSFSGSVQASMSKQQASATYSIPNLTLSGHSLSFKATYSKQDKKDDTAQSSVTKGQGQETSSSYQKDIIDASVRYGIPVSDYVKLTLGTGFSEATYSGVEAASSQVRDFFETNPLKIQGFNLSADLSYVKIDSAYMPTEGIVVQAGASSAFNDIGSSYAINAGAFVIGYYPVAEVFEQPIVLRARVKGYVVNMYNSDLTEVPFYMRFYAGGLGSVRGYKNGSLGPTYLDEIRSYGYDQVDKEIKYGDVIRKEDKPKGGNKMLIANLELQMPSPNPDMVIPYLFVDYGNVFDDSEDISLDAMRGSMGLSGTFKLPMATFTASLAVPFNDSSKDTFSTFSFATGVMF